MEPNELLFGSATDPGQVFAALAGRYQVHVEPAAPARVTFLDTADWRLHRAGLVLSDERVGRRRQLVLSRPGAEPVTGRAPAARWPRPAQALPDSPARDQLSAAARSRALLPLADVEVRALTMRLLDAEEKTRVRVRIEQQRLLGDRPVPLPLRVVIAPLRGYDRDGERCAQLLGAAIGPMPEPHNAAAAAFTAAGHRPGQSPVAPIQITPGMPAADAVRAVLRHWLDTVEVMRPGVIADIDIEYLHELRTSVRAMRSVLRFAEPLLRPDWVERFGADVLWLARLTSLLRDLDVALVDLSGHGALDVSGLDGLDVVRAHLARQRRAAWNAVRAALESPHGAGLHARLTRELGEISHQPAIPTAQQHAAASVRRAYRRIVTAAAAITPDTPIDDLHRVRRRCKQMRYLLDSYGTVLPPHAEVHRALRSLQACLGDIQDADVQRSGLADLATQLAQRNAPAQAVVSIGALRERALARDTHSREILAGRLADFSARKMRRQVRDLEAAPS